MVCRSDHGDEGDDGSGEHRLAGDSICYIA